MCNLAGFISNNRDRVAETEKGILAPMTRTMECPGPDAGGLLTGRHVDLNHCRPAVIDIVGDAQPIGDDATKRRMRKAGYLHVTRFVQYVRDHKNRMSTAQHSPARCVRLGVTLLALAGGVASLSACSDWDPPISPPSASASLACSVHAEGRGSDYLDCLRMHGPAGYGFTG